MVVASESMCLYAQKFASVVELVVL
eukprot:COSAG01_NODE_57488_length_312_cov_0.525822_1_plen_24_part_01